MPLRRRRRRCGRHCIGSDNHCVRHTVCSLSAEAEPPVDDGVCQEDGHADWRRHGNQVAPHPAVHEGQPLPPQQPAGGGEGGLVRLEHFVPDDVERVGQRGARDAGGHALNRRQAQHLRPVARLARRRRRLGEQVLHRILYPDGGHIFGHRLHHRCPRSVPQPGGAARPVNVRQCRREVRVLGARVLNGDGAANDGLIHHLNKGRDCYGRHRRRRLVVDPQRQHLLLARVGTVEDGSACPGHTEHRRRHALVRRAEEDPELLPDSAALGIKARLTNSCGLPERKVDHGGQASAGQIGEEV
mmetsp:Transcript_30437/g.98334  ORF Transcript_30437/g.98334 Transcript_30437/m.98334 type:complete len:300 (+) Transcript_30437:1000-1899(+)